MTYKNPKGFTLIELLAVIVILAVIALILTPIVSGIIKTAKKNAFESTGYGILESTKLYYSKKVGELNSDLTFTCNNDECTSGEEKLEFKGNINGSGTVLLFKDGNIALCLENSNYATLKNVNDERLSTTEQGTCEFDEETKEYSVNASVSAKLYEELQNQYTVLNNNYNNGKQALAEAITSMGVETNTDLTLEEMAENVTNINTGNINLRYNEETEYIQALDENGIWRNIYQTSILPITGLPIDLIDNVVSSQIITLNWQSDIEKIFDKNDSTGGRSVNTKTSFDETSKAPVVGYDFVSPVQVTSVNILLPNVTSVSGNLQYSDDNITWYDACSVVQFSINTTLKSSNGNPHRYWRVYFSEQSNNAFSIGAATWYYLVINEIMFYGYK